MVTTTGRTKSNSFIAAEKLRKLIISGTLGAGSDHLESELAASLNMSRTPVREAVLLLESHGLLEVRPRKGVRISPISVADMSEIYDILTELESLAAAHAAQRNFSSKDLRLLSRSITRMEKALAQDDRETWAENDDIFHSELARLGGNKRLQRIVATMSDQVRRARTVTLYMRPAPDQSNADHRGVLNAIEVGDAKTARDIHRNHRKAAKSMLIDLLNKHHLTSV